jgi:hypothetical protein
MDWIRIRKENLKAVGEWLAAGLGPVEKPRKPWLF